MAKKEPEMTHPFTCIMRHVQGTINIHGKPVIWVVGGPGIGKGVQCQLLNKRYGFVHLSVGEVMRAEVQRGGEQAQLLQTRMTRGDLVPNDIQLELLKKEMQRLEPSSTGFIIDGFPRERDQGIAFEKYIAPATILIYLEASPEMMMKRLKSRAAAAAVRRADDNVAAFQDRINNFFEECNLIINQYRDKLCTVNGEGNIEEVFSQVRNYVDPVMKKAHTKFPAE